MEGFRAGICSAVPKHHERFVGARAEFINKTSTGLNRIFIECRYYLQVALPLFGSCQMRKSHQIMETWQMRMFPLFAAWISSVALAGNVDVD